MRKFNAIIVICLILGTFAILPSSSNAVNNKITVTPASRTLQYGNVQIVEIKLTQPIICPAPSSTTSTTEPLDPDNPNPPEPEDPEDPATCKVRVNLVNSDSNRVSLDKTQVTWLARDWSQSRYMTATVLDDGIDNLNDLVTISGTSANIGGTTAPYYYDGSISIALTITDSNDTTTTTLAPTSTTHAVTAPSIELSKNNIAPKSDIVVQGKGFKANSEVTVTLHSEPIVLGKVITNAEGTFSKTFSIPKNAASGNHQVIATGFNALGEESSSVQALTVSTLPATGNNAIDHIYTVLILFLFGSVLIAFSRKRSVASVKSS